MSRSILSAKTLLADAIGASEVDIPDDARVTNYGGWDSIAHLRLMLALEAHLGRELDSEEAVGIESLQDVATFLNRQPSQLKRPN